MNYKQINCKFCPNKTFGINYKYQHEQTKQHRRNIIKEDKKKELLTIDENKFNDDDINTIIKNIEFNLNNLKKLIN
jgi:hypothetical protein